MTAPAAVWPPASAAHPDALDPQAARGQRRWAVVAFCLSVFVLLIHSQAWVAPIQGDRTDDATSALIRDGFFPAYIASVMIMAFRPRQVVRVLVRQPFLVAMMLIVVASTLWSVEPEQTTRRAVAILFTTLGGVVLGARWRWATLVEVFAVAFGILTLASLFAGLFIPSVGRMATLFPGAWRGLWPEKNGFGGLMTFAILFYLPAARFAPQRWMLWVGMACISFALLLLSTSKTSLVSLTVGLAVMAIVLLARRGGAMTVLAVYTGVLGAVGLAAVVLLTPETILGLLGKDATLTGRTKIWAAVLNAIHKRPWLGYGYGAVWTETDVWGPLAHIVREAGFKPEHAHNSWLEQWLGLGLLGLGAWTLYYVTTLARALWAVFTSRGALIVFPFLMVYTLISLTESVVLYYNDLRWLTFVALASRLVLPQPAADR